MDKILRINQVSKSFKNNSVLKDISYEVGKGELHLVVGRNGSGKSTLLKIIAGISKPDSGEISLADYQIKIGAMIENPSFLEELSLKDNLVFLFNLASKYNQSVCESLCKEFFLDFHSKVPMKNYSVGMRQKAGIIQAIMEDQTLILLDEPTRGMDDESIAVFDTLITSLKSEGKTIIIATHDSFENLSIDSVLNL